MISARDLRGSLCIACLAAVALAGCGGAEARKARHLQKGDAYYAAGNVEKARVEYRNALQIAPNDSLARYDNGRVEEKLGRMREAARFYQGALDANADNVAARAALGRLFLFGGAPERALEVIKPAFDKHPDDPGLLTVRAAVRVQLKDPDGGLQDAERAVELAPTSEDAVAVLAGIYKSRNDTDKSRDLLERSVKAIPATVDLRLALAQLYASLKDNAKAEALLVELVRINPNEATHRVRLAQFYAHLDRLDDSERVLREGIKALPANQGLKVQLIDFLAARRSRDAAAKELDAMVAANPKDYDLRLSQAQFFEQGKEFPKAETAYRQIIDAAEFTEPGLTARDRLAALKVQQNDVAGAEKLLAEVLAKNPRDNDALIMRGNLRLAEKDPKSAIADLRSVLRDQPNAVGVMRVLARAHLANGEPALAEETMRRAVEANPKDADARLDLAQLLAELGKAEQAKPVIDELVRQQPGNLVALETQFKVAATTGDRTEAQAAADAMVASHPAEAIGYFNQGAVAESSQRLEDALKLYAKALEINPKLEEPMQGVTRMLVKLNRTPEALKRLDETAAKFPDFPVPLTLKGDVLLETLHAVDAETAYKAAMQRQPRWWVPYRGLAIAEEKSGDSSAAIAALKDGVAKASATEALSTELAGLLEKNGKPDEAIDVSELEVRKYPQSDIAANNLAMLLITYKSDPQSLEHARSLAARFANSSNASFLDTYGWVQYKRGDSAAAVTTLQSALAKTPDSPVSLYHLGMAQASAGQSDAARDNLARSLKSGKNFNGMNEAKATLEKLTSATAASKS
jgi:tetratricopeptide (TPR) repeat protein